MNVKMSSCFMQVVDIRGPGNNEEELSSPSLTFDPEWLAITRALHTYLSLDRYQTPIPRRDELDQLLEAERIWVKQNLLNGGLIEVNQIQQFVPTAPSAQPGRLSRQQCKVLSVKVERNSYDYVYI